MVKNRAYYEAEYEKTAEEYEAASKRYNLIASLRAVLFLMAATLLIVGIKDSVALLCATGVFVSILFVW